MLDAQGQRMQDSGEEATLSRPLFDKLLAELTRMLDLSEDRLAVSPMSATHRQTLGPNAPADWLGHEEVFVV